MLHDWTSALRSVGHRLGSSARLSLGPANPSLPSYAAGWLTRRAPRRRAASAAKLLSTRFTLHWEGDEPSA